MAKELLTLENGTTCSSWNYSGTRLAAGSADGTLSIFDSRDLPSSSLRSTFKSRVHEGNIMKIVWVPPEYGDAVACISADGILSLLEEVVEGIIEWFLAKIETSACSKTLNILSLGTELHANQQYVEKKPWLCDTISDGMLCLLFCGLFYIFFSYF